MSNPIGNWATRAEKEAWALQARCPYPICQSPRGFPCTWKHPSYAGRTHAQRIAAGFKLWKKARQLRDWLNKNADIFNI